MITGRPPITEETGPSREADRLEGYVRSAARLRLEIAPFLQDQSEMLRGRRVLYCVDTNIVRLFTAPAKTGPRNRIGGAGYGVVFPDDDDISAGALAAALSRFIFYRLTHKLETTRHGSVPLVLLLGHDAEIRRLYDSVESQQMQDREIVSDHRRRLVAVLSSLAEEPDIEARMQIVREETDNMFRYLFFDDTPTDQFNRFNKLISDARIARLSSFASGLVADIADRKEAKIVEAALAGPGTLAEQSEESFYRLDWASRLSSVNRIRSQSRLSPDVAALARLEFINRRLRDTSHSLALITGDDSMRRAATRHSPFGEAEGDFASLYLRHPRAFLAADEVLLPSEAAEHLNGARSLGLVSNWLDALLARYISDQEPRRLENVRRLVDPPAEDKNRLRQRVEESLRLDSRAADRMKLEWDKHLDVLREEHSAPSRLAREEIERILGAEQSRRYVGILEEVDRRLADRSEQTWKTFFEAMVRTGYDILTVDADEKRSRNAPPLDFDSLQNAKEFSRSVINGKGYLPIESPEVQRRLTGIRDEDPTGYAHLLAFATLFANAGRWHVASLLSTRAITIARRLASSRPEAESQETRSPTKITGREAFYFTAVANRMCAGSLAELDGLESYIEDARLALISDKKRESPARIDSARFDSEHQALTLTRILFRFFLPRGRDKPVEMAELRRLLSDLSGLAERASGLEDRWIREVVRRNVLTNYFMTMALLCSYPAADALRRSDKTAQLANLYRATDRHADELPDTRLVSVVRLFATIAYGSSNEESPDQLRAEVAEIESHLRSDKSSFIMPYDRRRYEYLVEQIKGSLVRRSGV
jgi:hypothetical protein